jgi:4-hydroxybenzoyl-CoA thioesterase
VPEAIPGTNFVNRRELVVEWGHCDPAGIVFHPRFIEYFDWCSAMLFEAALGITKPEMQVRYGILGIPIVDIRARFLSTARYGEKVEIHSSVNGIKRSSFEVIHVLVNQGVTAVECMQTRVWCERDPSDPTKMKAKAIPADVIEKLTSRK